MQCARDASDHEEIDVVPPERAQERDRIKGRSRGRARRLADPPGGPQRAKRSCTFGRSEQTLRGRQPERRAELGPIHASAGPWQEVDLLPAGPHETIERSVSRIPTPRLDRRDGRLRDA